MLIYKIVDKPVFIGESKTLEINTDSLIVVKNNERFQIPYHDIDEISIQEQNKKNYLRIVYSGGDKSKKQTFTIGNVNSPQIIVETIISNIKRERNIFFPIKLDFDGAK